jgi:hypothetical protein
MSGRAGDHDFKGDRRLRRFSSMRCGNTARGRILAPLSAIERRRCLRSTSAFSWRSARAANLAQSPEDETAPEGDLS